MAQYFDVVAREKCNLPLIDGVNVGCQQYQTPDAECLETCQDAIGGTDGGHTTGRTNARANILGHCFIESGYGRAIEADQVNPRVGEEGCALLHLCSHCEQFLGATAR